MAAQRRSALDAEAEPKGPDGSEGPGRRRVLAYLLAAPTLAVGVRFGVDSAA